MTKMLIADIGFQKYAIPIDLATALLKIAEQSKLVQQVNYNGPYYLAAEQQPWVTELRIADVIQEPPAAPAERVQPAPPPDENPF